MFKNIQVENFDGLEMFLTKDTLTEFPSHYHEPFCISLIEKGIFIENDMLVAKNSLLISHPFEVHKNSVFQDTSYSLKTFYVNEDILKFALRGHEDFLFQKVIDDPELFRRLNSLAQHVDDARINSRLDKAFEKNFLQFLSGLNNYALQSKCCTTDEPSWVQEVKSHILFNLDQKINLEWLTKLTGLSKFKFIRTFKQHVGLSPFQFIVLNRVLIGKKMLKEGKSPLDAALNSGFYDQSNFTNYFRQYIGTTPKAYQKSCNIFQEEG